MDGTREHDITDLLVDWSEGDPEALSRLLPRVYAALRELADRFMRRERRDHTLQSTAVVHEVYLRLVDQRRAHWRNRAHFYAVAARMMRRILVDHARSYRYAKRRGRLGQVSIDGIAELAAGREPDPVAVDEALTELGRYHERAARTAELRFFGGLTTAEIAAVLGLSETTVLRSWRVAKAWLYRYLAGDAAPPPA